MKAMIQCKVPHVLDLVGNDLLPVIYPTSLPHLDYIAQQAPESFDL